MDSKNMIGETIRLRDGRKLGYACFGDRAGKPILYCAGGLGTRLQIQPTLQNPIPDGIRLIAIDRPGLGLSDFQPGRKILDYPADLLQLADIMGIESFSILGVSAGGAYAMACALKIPQRIQKCGLVSSATPPELSDHSNKMIGAILWIYRSLPWFTRLWFWWSHARHVGKSETQIEAMLKQPFRAPGMFCEMDRKLWSNKEFRRHDILDHLEAFRQGTRGPVYEAGLWGQPWGFHLEDITFDRFYLWHGEEDVNSPLKSVRAMVARLPSCEVHYYPEHGHSVGTYYWHVILQTIAGS